SKVCPVFWSVPVRFTGPTPTLRLPEVVSVKTPPRFTVPVGTLIVPLFVQFPAVVRLVTAAVIVPALVHVFPELPSVCAPVPMVIVPLLIQEPRRCTRFPPVPRIVMFGPMVSVPGDE